MSWNYLDLADFLLVAEAVLEIPAERLLAAARVGARGRRAGLWTMGAQPVTSVSPKIGERVHVQSDFGFCRMFGGMSVKDRWRANETEGCDPRFTQ